MKIDGTIGDLISNEKECLFSLKQDGNDVILCAEKKTKGIFASLGRYFSYNWYNLNTISRTFQAYYDVKDSKGTLSERDKVIAAKINQILGKEPKIVPAPVEKENEALKKEALAHNSMINAGVKWSYSDCTNTPEIAVQKSSKNGNAAIFSLKNVDGKEVKASVSGNLLSVEGSSASTKVIVVKKDGKFHEHKGTDKMPLQLGDRILLVSGPLAAKTVSHIEELCKGLVKNGCLDESRLEAAVLKEKECKEDKNLELGFMPQLPKKKASRVVKIERPVGSEAPLKTPKVKSNEIKIPNSLAIWRPDQKDIETGIKFLAVEAATKSASDAKNAEFIALEAKDAAEEASKNAGIAKNTVITAPTLGENLVKIFAAVEIAKASAITANNALSTALAAANAASVAHSVAAAADGTAKAVTENPSTPSVLAAKVAEDAAAAAKATAEDAIEAKSSEKFLSSTSAAAEVAKKKAEQLAADSTEAKILTSIEADKARLSSKESSSAVIIARFASAAASSFAADAEKEAVKKALLIAESGKTGALRAKEMAVEFAEKAKVASAFNNSVTREAAQKAADEAALHAAESKKESLFAAEAANVTPLAKEAAAAAKEASNNAEDAANEAKALVEEQKKRPITTTTFASSAPDSLISADNHADGNPSPVALPRSTTMPSTAPLKPKQAVKKGFRTGLGKIGF